MKLFIDKKAFNAYVPPYNLFQACHSLFVGRYPWGPTNIAKGFPESLNVQQSLD